MSNSHTPVTDVRVQVSAWLIELAKNPRHSAQWVDYVPSIVALSPWDAMKDEEQRDYFADYIKRLEHARVALNLPIDPNHRPLVVEHCTAFGVVISDGV